MGNRVEGNRACRPAAAAIGKYQSVTLDASGNVTPAGAGGKVIGVSNAAYASGDVCTFDLIASNGNFIGLAAGAIAALAYVAPAANGQWTTAAGVTRHIAGHAAAAAGDSFEIWQIAQPT